MTPQPEPMPGWSGDPALADGPGTLDDAGILDDPGMLDDAGMLASPGLPAGPGTHPRRWGGTRSGVAGRRRALFALLLLVGLGGLTLAAVNVAVQVLPRQFTPAQQRAIATWEMQRRWRTEPASKIFPATVPYQLSSKLLDADGSLQLQARLLGVSPQTSCAAALATTAVVQVVGSHNCVAALRSTYADSTGALVATLAVVVLPHSSASSAARSLTGSDGSVQLAGTYGATPARFVNAFAVAGSPAAGFGAEQEQLSVSGADGPYLVLVTTGFADGRRGVLASGDSYEADEMASMAQGLVNATVAALGQPPPAPSCPGTPGC